jgi:hypothetical protein
MKITYLQRRLLKSTLKTLSKKFRKRKKARRNVAKENAGAAPMMTKAPVNVHGTCLLE